MNKHQEDNIHFLLFVIAFTLVVIVVFLFVFIFFVYKAPTN